MASTPSPALLAVGEITGSTAIDQMLGGIAATGWRAAMPVPATVVMRAASRLV